MCQVYNCRVSDDQIQRRLTAYHDAHGDKVLSSSEGGVWVRSSKNMVMLIGKPAGAEFQYTMAISPETAEHLSERLLEEAKAARARDKVR